MNFKQIQQLIKFVADNLRKGAATNTVQIASHLIKNNLIS